MKQSETGVGALPTSEDGVRSMVRSTYAEIATKHGNCCSNQNGGSERVGYSEAELQSVPEGADLGLGCGNPQAIASLADGESVLDLGSGAGFDCFLAARQVGPAGSVIGVDMTPEMVHKARANASTVGVANVDFRLGEIERLPVVDNSIDVVMSNCVINLSPAKERVFKEAFRVLKPGGRLAIADIVQLKPLPEALAKSAAAYAGCAAGAATMAGLAQMLGGVGFANVEVTPKLDQKETIEACLPGAGDYVASATITGVKPTTKPCCAPACCDGDASSLEVRE